MPGEKASKSAAMAPVRVEMLPILISVGVTPGALDAVSEAEADLALLTGVAAVEAGAAKHVANRATALMMLPPTIPRRAEIARSRCCIFPPWLCNAPLTLLSRVVGRASRPVSTGGVPPV